MNTNYTGRPTLFPEVKCWIIQAFIIYSGVNYTVLRRNAAVYLTNWFTYYWFTLSNLNKKERDVDSDVINEMN